MTISSSSQVVLIVSLEVQLVTISSSSQVVLIVCVEVQLVTISSSSQVVLIVFLEVQLVTISSSSQDGISETITARQEGPGALCRGAMGRRSKEKSQRSE